MAAEKTDGIELKGFTLPSGTRFITNGSSSMLVGESISTGLTISGVVERLTLLDGGVIRVVVVNEKRRVYVLPTGLLAEAL